MSNKSTYESSEIVHLFATIEDLQKPEQRILSILNDRLADMKMLDLGVGGGRTTTHFAPLVKEYVGVDYAAQMIEACEQKFSKSPNVSFKVVDARDMHEFSDEYFHFVLFSFNGLDYINHDDRLIALREIKRILKPDGVYVFSTHNLYAVKNLYSIEKTFNPIKLAWRLLRFFILLFLNGSPTKILKKNWAIINDGAHNFGLKTYYINPKAQMEQLEEVGFSKIRLFSFNSGKEINPASIDQQNDPWLYYLVSS